VWNVRRLGHANSFVGRNPRVFLWAPHRNATEQVSGPLPIPVPRECSMMGGFDRRALAPFRTFRDGEREPALVILMPTAARLASLRVRSPGVLSLLDAVELLANAVRVIAARASKPRGQRILPARRQVSLPGQRFPSEVSGRVVATECSVKAAPLHS
jgi:hypothetical protein